MILVLLLAFVVIVCPILMIMGSMCQDDYRARVAGWERRLREDQDAGKDFDEEFP